jgi:uncharacterized repeat protein (TIGR04138 family)
VLNYDVAIIDFFLSFSRRFGNPMKSPLQAMRDLLSEDTRYKIEAYQFIREALQFAHENLDEQNFLQHTDDPVDFDPADFDPANFESSDFAADDSDDKQTSSRHITGQQLCESCRQYAIEQYGYLARIVLESWGIHSTSDFGELVYNLIRIEQMRKSESDRREDFDGVYDFENAFDPKFEFSLENER